MRTLVEGQANQIVEQTTLITEQAALIEKMRAGDDDVARSALLELEDLVQATLQ